MKEIIEIIKKYNTFALFCHVNPDADALGSMNALNLSLKKLNKKAYMYCDGIIPSNLKFLNVELEENEKKILNADVCILLDCNTVNRIGKYGDLFKQGKIKVCIDHHQQGDYPFDYNLVDYSSPSTCDLIYPLLKELDFVLNCQIALNLYAGISSDTGCFKFSNTTAVSHKNTYELLNYNFDLIEANYNMFSYKQDNFLDFYKTAIKKTKSYFNNDVFVTHFNLKDYKKFKDICDNSIGFQIFDGIDGNEIRVKVIERKKGVLSVAFRSNKFVDVCKIAKVFGGGGHINASGCEIVGRYKTALQKILNECKKELEKK